jgi:hypothetical protein
MKRARSASAPFQKRVDLVDDLSRSVNGALNLVLYRDCTCDRCSCGHGISPSGFGEMATVRGRKLRKAPHTIPAFESSVYDCCCRAAQRKQVA